MTVTVGKLLVIFSLTLISTSSPSLLNKIFKDAKLLPNERGWSTSEQSIIEPAKFSQRANEWRRILHTKKTTLNYSQTLTTVTPAYNTADSSTVPVFGADGQLYQLKPVLHPLTSSILYGIRRKLQQKKSDASSSGVIDGLDLARQEVSRVSEIKDRLEELRNLSITEPGVAGVFRGIKIRPLNKPASTNDSSEYVPLRSEGSYHTSQTLVVQANECGSLAEYWSSTEYSHVIQFSLQNMLDDNVTALQIDNASLFIYFQAESLVDDIAGKDNSVLVVISLNKQTSEGRMYTELVAYQEVNSTQTQYVRFDIRDEVRRWLKYPSRNHGLTLEIKSPYGTNVPLSSYINFTQSGCQQVEARDNNSLSFNHTFNNTELEPDMNLTSSLLMINNDDTANLTLYNQSMNDTTEVSFDYNLSSLRPVYLLVEYHQIIENMTDSNNTSAVTSSTSSITTTTASNLISDLKLISDWIK